MTKREKFINDWGHVGGRIVFDAREKLEKELDELLKESVPLGCVVMPKIAEENYKKGLQFGIDYCDTQMNILQEIHKDQPITSLKAIQKYLDVKKQLVNERDSNFTV